MPKTCYTVFINHVGALIVSTQITTPDALSIEGAFAFAFGARINAAHRMAQGGTSALGA